MNTLRLCEGGSIAHSLDREQRHDLEAAALWWQTEHRLRAAPLWFAGADNQRLHAAHNVAGIVEAGGVTVEIYPKLDQALLDHDAPDGENAATVLGHLLWLLEVGEQGKLAETGVAGLEETPDTFFDLWAFLLGQRLLRELELGVPRAYQHHEDDLRLVRGHIRVAAQVTRNWNRLDRIACAWDEFAPDTPLNRLFKCCLQFLLARVPQAASRRWLESCLWFFDEVNAVDAATALQECENLRWDRSTERFRLSAELARRLLQSRSHRMNAGRADTFVFLVDMAAVFEAYTAAVLSARFGGAIETQKQLGTLFALPKSGIRQIADYFWHDENILFIGDAKYKHLARGQNAPLHFADIDDETAEISTLAGRVLSASDVRQLTVYGELARRKYPHCASVRLLLLYPFVGQNPRYAVATTWSGAQFFLVPVGLQRRNRVADCLPTEIW